ncbi:MAG: LTA synthase family protein [Oscillospiraceae bacterium]
MKMRLLAAKQWGKRHRKPLMLVPILFLLLLGFVFGDFFFYQQGTLDDFVSNNFSNPITEQTPIQIFFKPQYKNLKDIEFRFVLPYDEATEVLPVNFSIYNSAGVLQQQGEWEIQKQEEDIVYSILPTISFKKAEEYRLVLSTEQTDGEKGVRISIGENPKSNVSQWIWGEQIESEAPEINLQYHRFSVINFLFFSLNILCMVLFVYLPSFASRKRRFIYQLALLLAAPLPIVFLGEKLNYGDMQNLTPRAIFLNYFFILTVFVLLYAISNRFQVSIIGASGVLLAFSIINYFTLQFRHTVVLPSDIYGVRTAAGVVTEYEFSFSLILLLSLVLWVFFIYASLWNKVKIRPRYRLISVACALSMLVSGIGIVNTPSVYQNMGVALNQYQQTEESKTNGFFANFAINIPKLFPEKPSGYSAAALGAGGYSLQTEVTQTPHIVVVMNEALSDLSIAGDIGTTEDPLPFIHSLANSEQSNVHVGSLAVPVFGGGTSSSEFEVLTGFSLALDNVSTAPFSQYVLYDFPAWPSQMQELGYTTMGTHPSNASHWNRNRAYPFLGFEETYFIDSYDQSETMRGFITDEDMYGFMIDYFEENHQNPLFMFGVTIQNHSGYTLPSPTYPAGEIEVEISAGYTQETEQYFSLIRESDRAFENLLDYFETVDEPVIVVMFGDHWPGLDEDYYATLFGKSYQDLSDEEKMQRYETPLIVWNNYGADFSSIPSLMSANYVMPVVKSAAGLPLTDFDQMLLSLREEYPVITTTGILNSHGQLVDNIKEEWALPSLYQYRIAVYNGMFDTRNRYEEFFSYIK